MKEETKSNLITFFKSNPDSITFPLIAGFELEKNNIEQALEILNQGLNYHPDYSYGHYVLSKALITQGDIDSATEELKLTIKYDPDFLQAYYDLIDYSIDKLNEKEFEHYIERIQSLNPFEKKEYFIEKKNLFKEKNTNKEMAKTETEKQAVVEVEPSFDIIEKEEIPEEEAHLGPIENITKETEQIEKKTEKRREEELESQEKPRSMQTQDKLTSIFEKLKSAPYGSLGPLDIEEFQRLEKSESQEEEAGKEVAEPLTEEEKVEPEKPLEKQEEITTERPSEKSVEEPVETEKKEEKGTDEEIGKELEKPSEVKMEKPTSDDADSLELKIPVPTFTLVEVLIKQKLFDQALEVLKVLEKRKKDMDKIEAYRKQIIELKEKEQKE